MLDMVSCILAEQINIVTIKSIYLLLKHLDVLINDI